MKWKMVRYFVMLDMPTDVEVGVSVQNPIADGCVADFHYLNLHMVRRRRRRRLCPESLLRLCFVLCSPHSLLILCSYFSAPPKQGALKNFPNA